MNARRIIEVAGDDADHAHAAARTGYWGRRAAGCLVLARATGRILFPLRSDAVMEPGTWGTWGGAINTREDPAAAAEREATEELGHSLLAEKAVPLYVFRDGSFSYHNFLVVVPNEFVPRLNWESRRAEWRDFGDWPSPLHPGLRRLLADPRSLRTLERAAGGQREAKPGSESESQ